MRLCEGCESAAIEDSERLCSDCAETESGKAKSMHYGMIPGTQILVHRGHRFLATVGNGWDENGLPNVIRIDGTVGEAAHTVGAFWADLGESRELVGLTRCIVFVRDVTSCFAGRDRCPVTE